MLDPSDYPELNRLEEMANLNHENMPDQVRSLLGLLKDINGLVERGERARGRIGEETVKALDKRDKVPEN